MCNSIFGDPLNRGESSSGLIRTSLINKNIPSIPPSPPFPTVPLSISS